MAAAGFFNAILKVLLDDAEKAFSHGVLGRAVEHMAKGPKADAGVARAAQNATAAPPARVGQNVWQAAQTVAGEHPVPILKQILQVLESVARKIGILPRAAPGAAGPGIVRQITEIGQRFNPRHLVTQNTGGSAQYRFQQIAHQLSGKPNFKEFVPPPKTTAVPGTGGIGKALLSLGRFAGIASLATGIFGLAAAALKNFVGNIVDSNRELYRYNAELAASFAKLDIARMQLDIRQAQAVAPSGDKLNTALTELMTEFQPLRESLAKVANNIATLAVIVTKLGLAVARDAGPMKKLAQDFLRLLGIQIKNDEDKNKKAAAGMNADLLALKNPGGPGGMPGGKIVPPKQPAFLPPLVRPGGPIVRQNPGGK